MDTRSIYLIDGGKSLTKLNSVCTRDAAELQNLAIIIPYRDRLYTLKVLLNNLHLFLTSQKVNYGIYLVEPLANVTFNRALLLNIGFLESQKDAARPLNYSELVGVAPDLDEIVQAQAKQSWNCFVFHDADMYGTFNTIVVCTNAHVVFLCC